MVWVNKGAHEVVVCPLDYSGSPRYLEALVYVLGKPEGNSVGETDSVGEQASIDMIRVFLFRSDSETEGKRPAMRTK